MELCIVQLSENRRITAEVKDNLYYPFGYNMFLMERSKMIDLPDRMYYILKAGFFWYIIVLVQFLRDWWRIPLTRVSLSANLQGNLGNWIWSYGLLLICGLFAELEQSSVRSTVFIVEIYLSYNRLQRSRVPGGSAGADYFVTNFFYKHDAPTGQAFLTKRHWFPNLPPEEWRDLIFKIDHHRNRSQYLYNDIFCYVNTTLRFSLLISYVNIWI